MSETRTICQAIEDAAKADSHRGFRFLHESGVPGFPQGSSPIVEPPFYSYAQIERETAKFAGAIQQLGLRKGDRLALILPNNDEFMFTFLGAIRAGVIPVPIYPPFALGQLQSYLDNTRHIVARAGARALVTISKIKSLLGTVQASCPTLERVVALDDLSLDAGLFRPEKMDLSDVAFLQFTSGSTSRPKGVALTHGNLAANIQCICEEEGLRLNGDDIAVSWLPLYHDMGLIGFVLSPLFHRVPTINLSPLMFLKRPVTWFQTFTRYKASIAYAPNFAFALCQKRIKGRDLEGLDLSTWRVAGCGAEPIRPEALEGFADAFAGVGFPRGALYPCFGMAESSLAVTFSAHNRGVMSFSVHGPTLWAEGEARPVPEDDSEAVRLVSCGRPFSGHTVAIFEPGDTESAHPLVERKVGEIRIGGPSVMSGYWDDVEKTKETFAGPLRRTGDLGFLHEGELYVCGRAKEVIIIAGRKFYPQDIEWEASQVPGVRKGNVIAFGAKDPSGKEADRERVVLAYELQDKGDLEKAATISKEIRRVVQETLGITLDEAIGLPAGALPKTSSGKLQRAKSRELYELGELTDRPGAKSASTLDLVKHAAKSQFSYLKLAVLGGRKVPK